MKTLFLNPPVLSGAIYMKEIGRCGRRSVAGELWPQTGLACLAAVAEAKGHEARLIDAMAEGMSVYALEDQVREWNPDLIVINTTTPTFKNDVAVVAQLRAHCEALMAWTGTHVSALPEASLAESLADVVMINEAENTLAELLDVMAYNLKRQNSDDPARALATVRGIVWREHGGPIGRTPPRPPEPDLDAFPLPARHLMPNTAYRMPFFSDGPFTTVIPSRGCPWGCSFCRAGTVWGRKIRQRSVANVMGELRQIVQDLGIGAVVFMTDSLTLNRDWALELFQAIADEDLRFQWICNSRVDAVDLPLLEAMKRAGCKMVSYGVESGDPVILRRMKKRITLEQSRNAMALTRQAGLLSMAYFILGMPGETWATVRRSIRFAKEIRPDYVNFHIATPFPGTRLYADAQARGWLTTDDWDAYEEEGSAVMEAGELTVAELERAQKMAMRAFYLRPGRLLRELRALRSPADFLVRLRAGYKMVATVFGRKADPGPPERPQP